MVLSDLSLSQNSRPDEIKAALAGKLGAVLPEGSFRVIVRSYASDVRNRNTNKVNFQTMIMLDAAGRKAALERRSEVEAMGFRVSNSGDIQMN